MAWTVLFRPTAQKELADIRVWYRDRNDGTVNHFEADMDHTIAHLEHFPFSFRARNGDYRFAPMTKFNYGDL